MGFGFRRCLKALVMLGGAASIAKAAVAPEVAFPGRESAVFPVDDGRSFIALAPPGQDAGRGRLRGVEGAEQAEFHLDPVSRLVLVRVAGPAVAPLPLRPVAPPGAGFPVEVPGGVRGVTAGWVKQVDDRVLPLALLKIDYQGEVPAPGQPLLDGAGRLVAVAHEPCDSKSGYALPVEVVHRVVDGVKRDGRVLRGRLGVALMPGVKEARVHRVIAGSPASRAGLKPGDLLLELAGREVGDYADAVNAFYFLRPAVTVKLRVRRGGAEILLMVTPDTEL